MRVLLGALALLLVPSVGALSVEAEPRLPLDVDAPEAQLEVPLPELEAPVAAPVVHAKVADLSLVADSESLLVQAEPVSPSSQNTVAGIPDELVVPAAAAGGSLLLMVLAYGLGGLEWVRQAFGFGLFSRIEDNKLLEHPLRSRLHQTILENPGLPLTELCVRIGASWGTTVHHLRRLEHGRLVLSQRGRAGRMYFPVNSTVSNVREAWAATSSDTARKIARFVHDHPGTDQKTVCVALGLRNPAASKHLGRFEDLGLVASRFEARHRIYTPTQQLATLVAATPA
ncbi:MAG TPA: hypothetical protein VGB18_01630 [Candidatus Thermoplasmatota archaeon]